MTIWTSLRAAVLSSCTNSWLSWSTTCLFIMLIYVTTCFLLRFRSLSKVQSRFNFPDRASLSRMTGADAQAIIEHAYTYEFPLFFGLSLTYALTKVIDRCFDVPTPRQGDMTNFVLPDICHTKHCKAAGHQ